MYRQPAAKTAVEQGMLPRSPATPTVLVVEDQPALQHIIASTLEDLVGARALTAGDGREALEHFRRDKQIALVLLDVEMPGMDGITALQKLRALAPQLPVIISTGLPPATVRARLQDTRVHAILQKPFGISTLLAAVSPVLGR